LGLGLFKVKGLGFRVYKANGLGVWVKESRFRVSKGSGSRINPTLRVRGSGLRAWGIGFRA
jgi:hypothetical protein